MARHSSGFSPDDGDPPALQEHVERISETHGLPIGRVAQLLRRLALEDWLFYGLWGLTPLDDAIQLFGAEEGLERLERAELEGLAQRVDLLAALTHPLGLARSLSELADHLEVALGKQRRSRKQLLETGWPLPPARGQHGVFDSHLQHLYPTRRHPGLPAPEGEEVPALLAGLSEELEGTAGELRQWFLPVKLQCLEVLMGTVRRAAGDVPAALSSALTEGLLDTEVESLLEADECYGDGSFAGNRPESGTGFRAGGLSDLLTIAGHCQAELSVGAWRAAKEQLQRLPEDVAGLLRDGLAAHYFTLLGHPKRPVVDALLNRFLGAQAATRAAWDGYRREVSRLLDEELRTEETFTIRPRRKDRAHFKPQLEAFLFQLEADRRLPGQAGANAGLGELRPFLFQRKGRQYVLQGTGPPFPVNATRGMEYLEYLLRHPEQPIPVQELVSSVTGNGAVHDEDPERVRKRVTAAIRRALDNFPSGQGELLRVLDGEVHRGAVCQYLPAPGRHWIF